MPYIPHTPNDTKEMLSAIGAQDIQDLFDEIPASLQYAGFQNIPAGINEMEMLKEAKIKPKRIVTGSVLLVLDVMNIIFQQPCGILHLEVSF